MKIVFDTNCYYAAAAQPQGYMAVWLEHLLNGSGGFDLFVSPEILAEVQSKLESKLGYSPKRSVQFRLFIEQLATVVYPTSRLQVVRDKDDNKILECALEAKAHIVITMDKDLLDLKDFDGIKIDHPRMLKYWFKDSK
ncbi:MAG: putative toxin-antitoxin system toxin component, PIN family [Patescibacteria group bacterium]